jgi:hypothetical protein
MTVINNIEIDDIKYCENEIKSAINNNEPIEDKLHIIIVISNPCQYATRYLLAREFVRRMELDESNVELYIVELAYNDQQFYVTEKNNKKHLQIRTKTAPLWHKENMINLGVKYLLPKKWKAFAWIDADVEFENVSWALDTLKILNGCKDVVQLFSHCVDMDKEKLTMKVFNSFGYQYTKKNRYLGQGENYWHPGYAYACTRKAYEKMRGLFEVAVLGSGDNIMALSFINKGLKAVNELSTDGYKQTISDFQARCANLRIGYVPGVIRHYFHGSKKNRKYTERWEILIKHNFDPLEHVTFDKFGLMIPSPRCPRELLDDIMNYFKERNEDE